jgi:hypothetical protein
MLRDIDAKNTGILSQDEPSPARDRKVLRFCPGQLDYLAPFVVPSKQHAAAKSVYTAIGHDAKSVQMPSRSFCAL